MSLTHDVESRLMRLGQRLIDQQAAEAIVQPNSDMEGFWFGGGNMVEAPNGQLVLVGRYRNAGDSRTGLKAGERGLELAIFVSDPHEARFEKTVSCSKEALTVGDREVLSIEGACLTHQHDRWELFVSSEKSNIGYPAPWEDYLKPGTGVWTIERLVADSLEGLTSAQPETILECREPQWLHVKDPALHLTGKGDLQLIFCTHPYNWASSNTAVCVREAGQEEFEPPQYTVFPRGTTWDVAMSRTTAVLNVPAVGVCSNIQVSLMFYDGGESLRNLDEHNSAVKRPRGYSCEELGGLAYITDDDLTSAVRLSKYEPAFISPHGTGCSRYVDVCQTKQGFFATWQQSQSSKSQPLVMNFVSIDEVEALLS